MSRVVVIDTETTGLSPLKGNHRVIEIAAIEIIDGKITGQLFHSYINPEGKKSSIEAQKVHQLSASFLSTQPLFSEIAEALLEFTHGAELSYYNLKFDQGFIQAEYDRAGFDVVFSRDYHSSCLMMDVIHKVNNGRRLSLDNACRRFGIDISERKVRGAVVDAQLTAELYIKFHYSEEKALTKTPQAKKHSTPEALPISRAYKHPVSGEMIQLNYCKKPDCLNYGVPAKNPTKGKMVNQTEGCRMIINSQTCVTARC